MCTTLVYRLAQKCRAHSKCVPVPSDRSLSHYRIMKTRYISEGLTYDNLFMLRLTGQVFNKLQLAAYYTLK